MEGTRTRRKLAKLAGRRRLSEGVGLPSLEVLLLRCCSAANAVQHPLTTKTLEVDACRKTKNMTLQPSLVRSF